MKRYDMNNACDGESGQCRAEIIQTVYGDYVLHADAEEAIADLRARVAVLEAEIVAWRREYVACDNMLNSPVVIDDPMRWAREHVEAIARRDAARAATGLIGGVA